MPTQAGSSHRGGVGAGPTKRNTEEQKNESLGIQLLRYLHQAH